jgi:hypothetical protein
MALRGFQGAAIVGDEFLNSLSGQFLNQVEGLQC